MRILIPFIILSCIVCCRTKELRIPDQPGLSHLASPVFLKSDTTWVDLKDYFLYPEKIKKIIDLHSGSDRGSVLFHSASVDDQYLPERFRRNFHQSAKVDSKEHQMEKL